MDRSEGRKIRSRSVTNRRNSLKLSVSEERDLNKRIRSISQDCFFPFGDPSAENSVDANNMDGKRRSRAVGSDLVPRATSSHRKSSKTKTQKSKGLDAASVEPTKVQVVEKNVKEPEMEHADVSTEDGNKTAIDTDKERQPARTAVGQNKAKKNHRQRNKQTPAKIAPSDTEPSPCPNEAKRELPPRPKRHRKEDSSVKEVKPSEGVPERTESTKEGKVEPTPEKQHQKKKIMVSSVAESESVTASSLDELGLPTRFESSKHKSHYAKPKARSDTPSKTVGFSTPYASPDQKHKHLRSSMASPLNCCVSDGGSEDTRGIARARTLDVSECQLDSDESYIDSHAHLDYIRYCRDNYVLFSKWEQLVAMYARQPTNFGGVVWNVVRPKYVSRDHTWMSAMVKHDIVLGVSVGCHPHYANEWNSPVTVTSGKKTFREFVTDMALRPVKAGSNGSKIRAIGECGIDTVNNTVPVSVQLDVFKQQLYLAKSTGLPVVIHCRTDEGADIMLAHLIQEILGRYHPVHRHCFRKSMKVASAWLEALPNCSFGFVPSPYSELEEVLKSLPLDKILLETDAPYFANPSIYPFRNAKCAKDRISHPVQANVIAAYIAKVKNLSIHKVFYETRMNTIKFYRLDEQQVEKNARACHNLPVTDSEQEHKDEQVDVNEEADMSISENTDNDGKEKIMRSDSLELNDPAIVKVCKSTGSGGRNSIN